MIKSIRTVKILSRSLVKPEDRILMNLQRSEVISTESDGSESSVDDTGNLYKPGLIKVFKAGKIWNSLK